MKKSLGDYSRKIAVALTSLLLALLLCEAVLRSVGYHYTPFAIRVGPDVNDYRFQHLFDDTRFVYDPDLIWRPKPNTSVFNAQGFRGRVLPANKQTNEYRIFAIGDSNTIGWPEGGPDNFHGANWPQFLEELLASRSDRKITVTNASAWGYSSFQGLEMVRRSLAYQPDLILISFGANDAHKVAVPDAQFNAAAFHSPAFNTRMGQLVKAAWDKSRGRRQNLVGGDLVFRVSPQEYRENLTAIIQICKEQGIACVLLTRPFSGESPGPEWWKVFAPEYVAATLEVGKENEVPVIDVHDYFKDLKPFFADECHFTEAGMRTAAKLIADKIQPLLP